MARPVLAFPSLERPNGDAFNLLIYQQVYSMRHLLMGQGDDAQHT